ANIYLGKNKKGSKALILLAGETGIEPATHGFGDRCSTN
ncbi:MAG: hypothetical protein PWP18_1146, partial [Thermoanaerobacter sp.]|nr:hypothetical protein [Thermoanaerobacter sp.]